mmetsp:Transcript_82905/g.235177  ORF Transcript_82905/g.235177 Transcript_82905/m.235177 type:complete len:446 (+) Transcript_82905:66-1403(+)
MAADAGKGWRITAYATCINLCNVLFVWGVIKGEIKNKMDEMDPDWQWGATMLNAPYSVATVNFSFAAFLAGSFYDKYGPRVVTMVGGGLMAFGLLVCSLSTSLSVWIFGFGICTSSGLGACFAVQTPTAVKWFPTGKAGLVAGIVLGGFGFSAVYLSPLVAALVARAGILMAMRYIGLLCAVVVLPLSQLLENPPANEAPPPARKLTATTPARTFSLSVIIPNTVHFTLAEALRTRSLWLCFLLFGLGGGCGVMMIGEGTEMAKEALGERAWVASSMLSIGNCAGRVIGGIMNDRIGLRLSLLFFFTNQALMMLGLMLIPKDSVGWVLFIATFLGFNYGANPTLWAVATKFFFGTKNFGSLFGFMLVGWGLGGLCLSSAYQVMKAQRGDIAGGCTLGIVLLLASDALIMFLDSPEPPDRQKSGSASVELGGSSTCSRQISLRDAQ